MANEKKKNIVHPHGEFDVMANLSMNEDTKKPFISYKTRIRWFRSVFPMGSVEVHYSRPKGPVDGRIPIGVTAEARVYPDCTVDSPHCLANAFATRYFDQSLQNEWSVHAVEWACTAATTRALIAAGFTIPDLDGQPDVDQSDDEKRNIKKYGRGSIVQEYDPSMNPKDPANKKKAKDEPEPDSTAEEKEPSPSSAAEEESTPVSANSDAESPAAAAEEKPAENTGVKKTRSGIRRKSESILNKVKQEDATDAEAENGKPENEANVNGDQQQEVETSEKAPEQEVNHDPAVKPESATEPKQEAAPVAEPSRGKRQKKASSAEKVEIVQMSMEEAMAVKFTAPALLKGKTFGEVINDTELAKAAHNPLKWYATSANPNEYPEQVAAARMVLAYLKVSD